MIRKNNELYIGLIVTLTIMMVIGSILYLERDNFLKHGMTINLIVQNAKGIKTGGDVLYEGLDVGSIVDTKLTRKGVLLKLKITEADSIPVDSRFTITTISLVGNKAVEIIPGKMKTYFKDGAYATGESGMGFSDILQNGHKITNNIANLVQNVDTLLNEKTRAKIHTALDKINKSVALIHQSLKNNLNDLHTTIENMKKITTDNKAPIDSIINRLSQHSKKVAAAMDNTEKITNNLNEIINGVKKGKGTAGKLLTNDELYNNLNKTVINLNNLIKDIKNHPDKYFHISVF